MKFSTVINIHENLILVVDEIKESFHTTRRNCERIFMHVEEEFGHMRK